MAITFQKEWYYAKGTLTDVPKDSSVSYYHVVCYSYGYYMMVLKYYTDESIEAPSITLRSISNGTSSTKYLGAYFVSCGQDDTPDSNLTKNALTLEGKCQARLRFGYNCTGMDGSWVSGTSQKATGTCTTDVKIPRGYFFVYIGCANSTTPGWTTVAANKNTVSGWPPAPNGTDLAHITITYNANGGSGAPAKLSKYWGVDVTLSSSTCTKANTAANGYLVTYKGNGGTSSIASDYADDTLSYTHASWNTASGGSGTTYALGGTYSGNSDVTLYAIYTSSRTRGTVPLPTASRNYFNHLGWSTNPNATAATYAPGASFKPTAATTLYAVWERIYVDITFEPVGGTIDNKVQRVPAGVAMTLPDGDDCVRVGALLLGWDNSSSADGADYQPGGSYTPTAAATLYAVWMVGNKAYVKTPNGWKIGDIYIKSSGVWLGG